ncbi:hypothetical protein C8R47DRAFT_130523 [Mycena vitilis]|nr:hypothetical protein C8R47DRAFT_130523 [Mycena vitilis]
MLYKPEETELNGSIIPAAIISQYGRMDEQCLVLLAHPIMTVNRQLTHPSSSKKAMSSAIAIPELLIQIIEHLSLLDLISAAQVSQQWRALVPKIDSPTRLRLLGLAFRDVESSHPIPLDVRLSYVNKVETILDDITIPEPYRTVLTEWPVPNPPPGMHWPHSLRFYASGFCFCPRHTHEFPDQCLCADTEVRNVELMMFEDSFRLVMDEGVAPIGRDDELFNNPVRLHTDKQNAQTMRFIRAHPAEGVSWSEKWAHFGFRVLQLSRYHFHTREGTSDGTFVMMLEGPTRGQIHAWASAGESWYDGHETDSFWDWRYVEWDQDAIDSDYDSQVEEGEEEEGQNDA